MVIGVGGVGGCRREWRGGGLGGESGGDEGEGDKGGVVWWWLW